jgi:Fe-S cluster biogenesis protein NfuA
MSEINVKVQKALDEIRPNIQADGGDVELVAVENGIVKVRLQGHCAGCPMSQMTLKQGIETHLKRRVPEVISVEAVR